MNNRMMKTTLETVQRCIEEATENTKTVLEELELSSPRKAGPISICLTKLEEADYWLSNFWDQDLK